MEQALYQASIVTFEELGFMFPSACADESNIADAESVSVAIDFSGEFGGKFLLRIEREVLPLIAANMLGEEPPFDAVMLKDVLGEIANVICGNMLPAIGGKAAVFHLGAPHVIEKFDASAKPSAIARLDLEDGRADVSLYLN